MSRYRTPYGQVDVSAHGAKVASGHYGLWDWANRPGAHWPCSYLAATPRGVSAAFDARGDLVDISRADLPGDEFNAWSSDVLAIAIDQANARVTASEHAGPGRIGWLGLSVVSVIAEIDVMRAAMREEVAR